MDYALCPFPRRIAFLCVVAPVWATLFPTAAVLVAQGPGTRPPSTSRPPAVAAPGDPRAIQTEITVELLTGPEGVGIRAQRWTDHFQRLNTTFSIRRGLGDEELETTEELVGRNTRRISIRGRVDKSGTITFADRSFKESEADRLAVWIRELKAHGTGGNAEGRPLWGLSKTQFGPLFAGLQRELTKDPRDMTLSDGLALFGLEADWKVEWSAAAKKVADDPAAGPVAQSLHGLTRGTALAILLAERDLGFKPKRMADGTIRLEFVSRREEPNTWPAGWPPDQAVNQIAPGYFKSTEIDIDKLPLADVLETAGDLMGLPVFVDRGGLALRGVDAATFAVSHPKKKTTWSLALKSLTFQARCDPEIRMDESGTAFLWVAPLKGTAPALKTTDRK
jgi:hypothetical protein